MKTAILSASLLANLGLGLYVALVEPDGESVPSIGARTLASTTKPEPLADGVDDAAKLDDLLSGAGIPASRVKAVVLAYLDARIAESAVIPSYEYWRREDSTNAQAKAGSIDERRETVRKDLLALYGPAAKEDAAFRTVFKPLQSQFPFLTSDQQIAVRRLQMQRQTTEPPGSSVPATGSPPPRVVQSSFETALKQIIHDDAQYLEYSMRDSPLARRLRSTAVDFTEDEYRRIFTVMEEFRSDPKPASFLKQREAVEDILGRDRSLELWASIDATYAAVRRAGEQHNLQDDKVWAAYELILDAQDDLLRMGAGGNVAGLAATVAERIERRDRMLGELVGDAAARSIAAAFGRRINELRGGGPPFPQTNRVVLPGGQP